MEKIDITCFKAYDIRGQLGTQLDNDIAYRIGRAYAEFLSPKTVVVGGDVRSTSAALKMAVATGLRDGGVDVLDIGLCGTEEIYFATDHLGVDGGIVVTASHNPIDYNGMKLVRENARPISADTGLQEIREIAENLSGEPGPVAKRGSYRRISTFDDYIKHLLGYVDASSLKPLKLVVNAGNGTAGPVLDGLENSLPFELIKIYNEPDGNFPHGIPNPLLTENRAVTRDAVLAHGADMGIAWDGDFDRCFLFDEKGNFIEGYYIVGLLAEAFLKKDSAGEKMKIVHDPRLLWNTLAICDDNGGEAVVSKSGHAFIKEKMRATNAVYGGEMSAHHYFRDFAYADSGMIPWLLICELVSKKGQPLSSLISERIAAYPCSGEINSTLEDADKSIAAVLNAYKDDAVSVDYLDGVSVDMGQWRFNLRKSNTEPLVRLNVESRGDIALMEEKTEALLDILKQS